MSFGAPTATGYSSFFDPTLARPGNGAEQDYNAMRRYGRGGIEMCIARMLAKPGFRGVRRAMRVLNGVAPGTDATETFTRVGTTQQGSPVATGPGGVAPMEVVTMNSGITTAAQQTYINNVMIDARFVQNPASYPVDLSGNGGGGKLGR